MLVEILFSLWQFIILNFSRLVSLLIDESTSSISVQCKSNSITSPEIGGNSLRPQKEISIFMGYPNLMSGGKQLRLRQPINRNRPSLLKFWMDKGTRDNLWQCERIILSIFGVFDGSAGMLLR